MRNRVGNLMVAAGMLALFGGSAQANVTLKNGNFFIGYTDISYPGGFEPKIERVYNTKTAYKGIFGWGWGTEYEVYLDVAADGSVVAHEYGGGAENRFVPGAFDAKELDRAVETIASVATKAGAAGSAEQLASYKTRLRTDVDFRNEEWEKYRREGKLKARELPVNTRLYSNRFSYQYVTRVAGGYYRTFDSGRVERFGEDGKLVRVQDKNGNFIQFNYKNGRIESLVDNFNRRISFSFSSKGLVEKIVDDAGGKGTGQREATYRYNALDELIAAKDVDGNTYTHKYSSDKLHNMIEIGYSDKTTMQMAYYGRAQFENIKSVKDRDGTVTHYSYDGGGKDRSHIKIGVLVKSANGKTLSDSKYEYFNRRKADGEEWTYKMVTALDGERTETTYNECCGLPLLIKRGTDVTAFEYNSKGNVTKKITPTDITELAYDKKAGKVSQVKRYSKTNKKHVDWSQFKYDAKANLVFARNSEGKGVKLFYDRNGRIKSMVDQGRRRIDFEYNENSKPIKITDPAVGAISVSYSNSGDIKKVESTAGRKIAMQVTSAFQNLLDIIRPAGVSLSF